MEIDAKVLSVAIGILLGATISAIAYYLKVREEKKKVMRECLYEAYSILALVAEKCIINENLYMYSYLMKYGLVSSMNDKEYQAIQEKVKSIIGRAAKKDVLDIDSSIEKYNSLVCKISSYYPLEAIRLRSTRNPIEELRQVKNLTKDEMEEWVKQITIEKNTENAMKKIITSHLEIDKAQRVLNKVLDSVLIIARLIGKKEHKVISNQYDKWLTQEEDRIEAQVDKIHKEIKSNKIN